MKTVSYIVAFFMFLLGFIFVAGNQPGSAHIIIGIVIWVAAAVIVYLTRMQPTQTQVTNVQKIDLTGDVHLEQMKCTSCGGALGKEHLIVKAGAIFVDCPYCGASYQIEEAPKW